MCQITIQINFVAVAAIPAMDNAIAMLDIMTAQPREVREDQARRGQEGRLARRVRQVRPVLPVRLAPLAEFQGPWALQDSAVRRVPQGLTV